MLQNQISNMNGFHRYMGRALLRRQFGSSGSIASSSPSRAAALVLSGCTGVGKSALAIRLAQKLNGEIISADSVAVYKHLNIGSDKPSVAWRNLVPHHLIDVADPSVSVDEPFTAADFGEQARELVREISSRGKLPIIVGGSGFYLSFLLGKYDECSATDNETKALIESAVKSNAHWNEVIAAISEKLAPTPERVQDNLVFLANIPTNNLQRLERAVHRLRNVKPDEAVPSYNGRVLQGHDDHLYRCVFLSAERRWLYPELDLRCERMLQRGLIDEVISLSKNGLLPEGSPPSLSIGYRQVLQYLGSDWAKRPGEGAHEVFDVAKFRVFVDRFQAAMRQYSRKQMTWFRRDTRFHWIDRADQDIDKAVMDYIAMSEQELTAMKATRDYQEKQSDLRTLPQEIVKTQKNYLPRRSIFRDGMNADTILHLMAQRSPL